LALPAPPKAGWIETIREALGMSLEVLGHRLSVTRQTAHELIRAEGDGSLSVKRMRAAANALECDLVVLFVPRRPLEETVRGRALSIARAQVARTGHSMALEAQSVSSERASQMVEDVADDLIDRGDPRLWD
jgi:predicted DNA-binding mobile mystery protein A